MRLLKIFLCVAMIFFVAISSGCGKEAVKGAFKSAGKTVNKATKKVPDVVKDQVRDQAIEMAYDAVTNSGQTNNSQPNNSQQPNNRPSNQPPPRTPSTSRAAKLVGAGAAAVGTAAVANEIANASDSAESEARQAFVNYHRAITDKDYRAAYEILSHAQRERVGDFNSYASGYANTISSEVSDMRLVSSDADSCTFDYTLTARDHAQGGKIKIAIFRGQVTMAKDNGNWYVRYAKSDKVDERYE